MICSLREWLDGLGLGRYADAFEENELDLDLVADISDADLIDLGVSAMGHRKKLLRAIAVLRSATTSTQEDTTAVPEPSLSAPQAERRQLTVMFCDLVGSTALSGRLDPEEMRDVILRYQNAVADKITRFEGHVAKYMGDGVLAYFGFPEAHEDDAERAARAGLSIVAATHGLRGPGDEALRVRVGIATGLVVVGDLDGEGAAQEEAVVGATPNLAARLQGLAKPGQVVVAESTRRILGDVFELSALGQQPLKGVATPVAAFAVLAERLVESRFEARQGDRLAQMVGRDQELALLVERWRQAKAGEGQLVLLTGEAGIGKSRITRALIDAVAADAHTRINYQCSPYHTDSPLYPTIQQFTRAAGFAADDTTETRLDKLEALLGRAVEPLNEAAPLIGILLGLDIEARYGTLDLSPQQQRMRTLRALVDQMLGLARQQPVLFVLEDVHWVDPTTLEMVQVALDAIAGARVLMLLTSRPDNQPEIAGHPHVTRFTLNRLSAGQITAIVDRLTGSKALPGELVDEIAAKTDGVPLFVEELTKTVLESGILRETDDAYVLDQPLDTLAIPTSLHDSLRARLDRLQPVKEVAQTAAVCGISNSSSRLPSVRPTATEWHCEPTSTPRCR